MPTEHCKRNLSNSFDPDDGHHGMKVLQPGVGDGVGHHVPPGSLHEQPVDTGPLLHWLGHLLLGLLGHLAGEAHLVQGQLVLPGGALHDRREEGLRVEEAREPD